MHKSRSRTRFGRMTARKSVIAALAIAALAPASAQAADSVGASATFNAGPLTVTAPATSVSFGDTVLDGRASYDLQGDIGNWNVNDSTGALSGWGVGAQASDPAPSDGKPAVTDAVMSMHVPTGVTGTGPAPTISTGDANGFVQLSGAGSKLLDAVQDTGVGSWDVAQDGGQDIRLVMPYNTRAVRYDSTLTFTVGQKMIP